VQPHEVAERIEDCLRPEVLRESAGTLRTASRTPVADPQVLFARARIPVAFATVAAAREDDDDTLYGWVNALTAHARTEPDLLRRFALERGAQRLLDSMLDEAAATSPPEPAGREALVPS